MTAQQEAAQAGELPPQAQKLLDLSTDVAGTLNSMDAGVCGGCGDKLGHGMDCEQCKLFTDPARTLVTAQVMGFYRKAEALLLAADAAENARRLYGAWDATERAQMAAEARTAGLEAAVRDAVRDERKAADRLRRALDYARECAEKHRKAKRDHASPQVQTDTMTRAQNSATVAEGEKAAAEGAVAARKQAEGALAAHRAEVARLEDAALAARKAAENPPDRVEFGPMTAFVGPTLVMIAHWPTLSDVDKALVAGQVKMLADQTGVTADILATGRAEGRKAHEEEIREQAMLTRRLADGGISAIPNPFSSKTPLPNR